MEHLHQRLKRLREARKLSVKKFAQLIGVPESTYREWEYGRPLSGPPFVRIAEALGVPLSYLMSGQSSENAWLFEELVKLESLIKDIRRRASSRN